MPMPNNIFKRLLIQTLILFSVVTACTRNVMAISDAQHEQLQSLCADYRAKDSAGMVIEIQQQGSEKINISCGMANIDSQQKMTNKTQVNVGSLTKQFTAAAIYMLTSENKLSPDSDLSQWYPQNSWSKSIKVRHLLSHTSGLREHWAYWSLVKVETDTLAQSVELITSQRQLRFEPGTQFGYTNSNYVLLADIIEKVTGQTFADYVESHIFAPMKMKDSHFYGATGTLANKVARAYSRKNNEYHPVKQPLSNILGDGGLFTTVLDLAKWNRRVSTIQNNQLKWLRPSLTVGSLVDGTLTDYAGGLWITGQGINQQIEHGGSANGISSYMAFHQFNKTSIVVLANTDFINAQSVYHNILKILSKPVDKGHASEKGAEETVPEASSNLVRMPRSFIMANQTMPVDLQKVKQGTYIGFANGAALTFELVSKNNQINLTGPNGITREYQLSSKGGGELQRKDLTDLKLQMTSQKEFKLVYFGGLVGRFQYQKDTPVIDPFIGVFSNNEMIPMILKLDTKTGGYEYRIEGKNGLLKPGTNDTLISDNGQFMIKLLASTKNDEKKLLYVSDDFYFEMTQVTK